VMERSLGAEGRVAELTALVSGAASKRGIGRGVALRLAREGRPIALLDRDRQLLDEAERAVRVEGAEDVACVVADVTDPEGVRSAYEKVSGLLPPVGAVVHCAGVADPTPIDGLSSGAFANTIAVNLIGAFTVFSQALPTMRELGVGRLVAISSTAAQNGGGNYSRSAYAASKAGLEGLMRGIGHELAGMGVTANSVSPANIDTDIMGGPLSGARREAFVERTPVGRLGTVEEVAELVAFLVGPLGGFSTGATYYLNGGMYMG